MREFNLNQEIKLPFDSIDEIKSVTTHSPRILNTSLAFRLKKHSNYRDNNLAPNKEAQNTELTRGMPFYLNRRTYFIPIVKRMIEPQISALNDDLAVKRYETYEGTELELDTVAAAVDVDDECKPDNYITDKINLPHGIISPIAIEDIPIEDLSLRDKKTRLLVQTERMLRLYSLDKKDPRYCKKLSHQQTPNSQREITKHEDVRRILGWGPTLEPQIDFINNQKHTGLVTVQLKPTARSTNRRAKEKDAKDLSDILANSISNQPIYNSIVKKKPAPNLKHKFDVHALPKVK